MLMKYFFIFVLLQFNRDNVNCVLEEETALFCPSFCECDLYDDLNRAICSGKRLIDPNVDIPPSVEILDLSYNDITQLDNNCFTAYLYLFNLSLSHNSIHTIYLDAFAHLHRVHTIDLSYNRLETIDERTFEMNRKLHTLHLEGNKFASLPNRPLISSTSLRVLNLRHSQIGYITTTMFEGVPKLLELDVSQNMMISMNPIALNVLHQLARIDLDGNPWNCDEALMKTVESLGRRNVDVSLIDCSAKAKGSSMKEMEEFAEYGEEFEKIMMPQPDEEPLVGRKIIREWRIPPNFHNRGDGHNDFVDEVDDDDDDDDGDDDEGDGLANLSNNWHDEISDTKLLLDYPAIMKICNGTQKRLCHRYREYLINASQMLLKRLKSDAPTTAVTSDTYTKTDLYFVFALGATVGVSLAVFIWSCTLCCQKASSKRVAHHIVLDAAESLTPPPPPPSAHRARPVTRTAPPRRQRGNAPSRPPRPPTDVVRSSAVPSNFLTGLFGRPARHQYYRTINQNTAILIRRLSRSNLFNNRDRERERERERRECNGNSAIENSHSPNDEAADHLIVIMAGEANHEDHQDSNTTARSETPPPSYGDVFVDAQQQQQRK